jgi:hypothetical protein
MTYLCNKCNKEYKSYKSLWNHNSIFHPQEKIIINRNDNKIRDFSCTNCNKKFTTKQSMLHHIENTCKNKIIEINNNKANDEKFTKLEKQLANLQKLIEENKNISKETKASCKNNSMNYVYLIEKYDVNNENSVYKFGKTNRPIMDRMKEHCNTSKILLILAVDDCSVVENNILKILNNDNNIIKEKDIGNEYFNCGDKQYIINIVLKNLVKDDIIV